MFVVNVIILVVGGMLASFSYFQTESVPVAIFIAPIAWLALIDLWSFFSGQGKNHRAFKNEIVTLGILGTFIGIFIGLWNFDVADITASVPSLLEGMKKVECSPLKHRSDLIRL